MEPLSWPALTLFRLTTSCANTSWRIRIPAQSSPTSKPATSERRLRSGVLSPARTRYSAPRISQIGLAALLRSAEPLPEHSRNNQTRYEKEHYNETNPNFKLSQTAARHLFTYCLRTHSRYSRRGRSDSR